LAEAAARGRRGPPPCRRGDACVALGADTDEDTDDPKIRATPVALTIPRRLKRLESGARRK
jgi:hypothetical protein